jgi:hypothetical protein
VVVAEIKFTMTPWLTKGLPCQSLAVPVLADEGKQTAREIIDLESAILTAVLGKSPDPRWSERLCAKAFTEKLRSLDAAPDDSNE